MLGFEKSKPETRFEDKGQDSSTPNWENIDVVDLATNAVIRRIQVRRGSIFPDRPKFVDLDENH